MTAFLESGVSQKVIAARLRKSASQVSRLLGGPGNWTIDMAAHLLYAINGNDIGVSETDPSSGPVSNFSTPEWLPSARYTEPHTEDFFKVRIADMPHGKIENRRAQATGTASVKLNVSSGVVEESA
ncbi:hypothetical protein [Frigidibacter sp. MR17.24]|uniref:hypothetical protein n=1 Tax=Frigidibacter sp. MR17.24 TaxID=3127345 RepID=UPI003012F665